MMEFHLHIPSVLSGVPGGEERLFAFRGDRVACFRGAEWQEFGERLAIGKIGGEAVSLVEGEGLPEAFFSNEFRALFNELEPPLRMAAGRARELAVWRRNHRFCGVCGKPMEDMAEDGARRCAGCGEVYYPVIAPAVITAVTDRDGRLLLARNAKFRNKMHSLIAGFVEPGEALEDAVRREVREEVGLEVDSIEYVSSQCWPFPSVLMNGFTARALNTQIIPDGVEIVEAGFYTPLDMPEIPRHGSISRTLIDLWSKQYGESSR